MHHLPGRMPPTHEETKGALQRYICNKASLEDAPCAVGRISQHELAQCQQPVSKLGLSCARVSGCRKLIAGPISRHVFHAGAHARAHTPIKRRLQLGTCKGQQSLVQKSQNMRWRARRARPMESSA